MLDRVRVRGTLIFESPEAFVAALEAARADWRDGYCFEGGVIVWMHGVEVPDSLRRIKDLVSRRQLPFRVTVAPGGETQHPDKHARLRVFQAAYQDSASHAPSAAPARHLEPVDSSPKQWDVFISHAGEDKSMVAIPLAAALKARDLRVWLDQAELTLGDSLRRKIDEGLAHSRFGVVILSPAFFRKHWPQKELDGLFARETSGDKVILPVVHDLTAKELASCSPMLADKVHVQWSDGLEVVVGEIIAAVSRASAQGLAPIARPGTNPARPLSLDVTGTWWSVFKGASPLYVRFEITRTADKPDAVRRAFITYEGRQVNTAEPENLPRLAEADFKDMILKFFPNGSGKPQRATLVLETVRGQTVEASFDTWNGGWRPPEVWEGFKPY